MTRCLGIFACLVALSTIFVTGCERSEEKTLPAAPPLTKVTVRSFMPFRGVSSWSQTITVYVAKAEEVPNLVDLRAFGDLQPGTTAERAESRWGKPNRTRTDEFGATWYSYQTPLGHAEVGCDKRTSPIHGSKEAPNVPCWWTLYAYTDKPASSIFREPVLSQLRIAEGLRPEASERSIELVDGDGDPILQAWLKQDRLLRMRLYQRLNR